MGYIVVIIPYIPHSWPTHIQWHGDVSCEYHEKGVVRIQAMHKKI